MHGADLAYRPDVDGLRALAIAVVVLGHAGLPGFTGGYVGVDVFFVISGFLITRLLLAAQTQGRWSLLDFYDRRVRRLVPALAVVLAVSAIAGWIILVPHELRHFGGMLASAALFGSNIFSWRTTDYFSPVAVDQPLLHTWSLGVEEQYYLLYPLVLWAAVRWGGLRALPWLLALGAAASLALSEHLVRLPSTAGYFMLPPRGFELLAGGLLALPGAPRPGRAMAWLAGGAGLLLIAGAVYAYGRWTPFPGLYAAAPVLGAALIIHAGGGAGGPVTWLLSRPAVVGLGQVSYSLYLWHWPILTFAGLWLGRSLTLAEGALGVAVALAAAIVSWRFVERPFRRPGALGGRGPRFTLAAVVLGALALAGWGMWASDGALGRMRPRALAVERQGAPPERIMPPCRRGVVPAALRLCGHAAEGPYRGTVVLWGDSHAGHFQPAVAKVLVPLGYTVVRLRSCSSPYGRRPPAPDCMDFHRGPSAALTRIPDVRLVIIAARWTPFLPSDATLEPGERLSGRRVTPADRRAALDALEAGLERSVRSITARGVPVIVFGEGPAFDGPPRACVTRAAQFGRPPAVCATPGGIPPDAVEGVRRMTDRVGAGEPLVWRYQPADAVCGTGRCSPVHDGKLLFRDRNHLGVEGARLHAERLRGLLLTALDRGDN